MKLTYKFKDTIKLFGPEKGAWHCVVIPKKLSDQIKTDFHGMRGAWGILPVQATIGGTTWKVTLFSVKKLQGFLMPIKLDVRKKEGLKAKDKIEVLIEAKF